MTTDQEALNKIFEAALKEVDDAPAQSPLQAATPAQNFKAMTGRAILRQQDHPNQQLPSVGSQPQNSFQTD